MMVSQASDLIRDSKLVTRFGNDTIRHIYYLSNLSTRQRRIRIEETWRRERQLGKGTFGRVWLETCVSGTKKGELRAVKEISMERSAQAVDYERELEAITKFSNDKYVHCFVKSHGWFTTTDAIFITMEYLEHGDLQGYLTKSFPESEVKRIVRQLVEGLVFMHDNSFAHRDLKPGNILVSHPGPQWWVKISDFGISKRVEKENTALRTVIGTEGYLAPEVKGFVRPDDPSRNWPENPTYTFAVDIWSLGEIAFRLMTEQAAFRRPQDLADFVFGGVPFPTTILTICGASEESIDFLTKTMSASPGSRPTAQEAASHAWILDSRPGSRASSRDSDVVDDVSSLATDMAETVETLLRSLPLSDRKLSFLTAHEQARMKTQFQTTVGEFGTTLTYLQTVALLDIYKLDISTLTHILRQADPTASGDLYFPEFALAIHLCELNLKGEPLPIQIPETIAKEVSTMRNFVKSNISGKARTIGLDPTAQWNTVSSQDMISQTPRKGTVTVSDLPPSTAQWSTGSSQNKFSEITLGANASLDEQARLETSSKSINNPKLLETVEDAIQRLILPELTALKMEQGNPKDAQGLASSITAPVLTEKHASDQQLIEKPRVSLQGGPEFHQDVSEEVVPRVNEYSDESDDLNARLDAISQILDTQGRLSYSNRSKSRIVKKSLEEEDKIRREAQIDRETERLRKMYGFQ